MDIAVDPRRRHAHSLDVVFGGFAAAGSNVQPAARERKGHCVRQGGSMVLSGPEWWARQGSNL